LKPILLNALLVGSAGFLGAVSRYAVGGAVHRVFPQATFPVGTLSVNLLGCFLVGALAGLADSRHLFTPELRAFVFIGLLGGFTTFSTFGYETVTLARGGEALRAVANVGAHVVVGLTLVWFGYGLASSR
jgi:CrcB protein